MPKPRKDDKPSATPSDNRITASLPPELKTFINKVCDTYGTSYADVIKDLLMGLQDCVSRTEEYAKPFAVVSRRDYKELVAFKEAALKSGVSIDGERHDIKINL